MSRLRRNSSFDATLAPVCRSCSNAALVPKALFAAEFESGPLLLPALIIVVSAFNRAAAGGRAMMSKEVACTDIRPESMAAPTLTPRG